MASRVNKQFVVLLAVGLIALVGLVAYVGMMSMRKSADDLVKMGDQAMKDQNHEEAVKLFAKAVNKDQRNAKWIERWIEAMEKFTPKTRQAYSDMYFQQYLPARKALCDADRTNPQPFERYLDERFRLTQLSNRLADWEGFSKHVDEQIKLFQGKQEAKTRLQRYKAMATIGMITVSGEPKEESVRGALQELDAAIAVEGTDWRSVTAAANLELTLAELARKRDDQATKTAMLEASRARLTKFTQDHPPAPIVKFQLLIMELADAARAYTDSNKPDKVFPGPELLKSRDDRMKEIVDGMRQLKPEELDPRFTLNIAGAALETYPAEGEKIAAELIEKARVGNPKDQSDLYAGQAVLLSQRGRHEESIALLRKVIDLPDMPVSVQGIRLHNDRTKAIVASADMVFEQWRATSGNVAMADPVKSGEFKTRFKALRDELVARVGEADLTVTSLDARSLMMQGDMQGARVKVTQYNDQTSRSHVPMLLMEAEILRSTGNLGGSEQVYQRVVELDPRNFTALMGLADISIKLAKLNDGIKWLTMASAVQPKNEQVAKMLADARAIQGGAQDNPVMRAIGEAQRLAEGITRDIPGAIKVLQDALKERQSEPTLSAVLAQLLASNGQREEARKVVSEALAVNPSDQRLKRMSAALVSDDPVQAQLEMIESAPGLSEIQKVVGRYEVYARAGQKEKAAEQLAIAKQMAPEDRVVVEMLFSDAINRKDQAELTRLADLAEKFNLDQMNGMLFRARVEITQQRYADAEKTLRDAVNRDRFNVLAWRLLGMVHFQKGEYASSSEALQKAVEINNTDLPTIKVFMRSLVQQGRYADALAIGRKSEKLGGGDNEFAEILLRLESEAPGGDRARAIQARATLAQRQPENTANRVELARLLINEKRFDMAGAVIDEIRAKDPMDPAGVELDAGLAAAQGRIGDTQKIFQNYIDKLPEDKRTSVPFQSAARMMASFGQMDAAVKLLEQGRRYQDTKLMPVDRELGDLMYNSGEYEKSVDAYERVLAGGGTDEGGAVRKRVIEANLRMKKFDQVDKQITDLGAEGQKDVTYLLLSAESAIGQGKRDRAQKTYDDAVRLFPKNQLVFLKRGDFNRADPNTTKDAKQDFQQVLRIDQNNAVALVRLANLHREEGDVQGSLEFFKRAMEADPNDDQVRLAYIDLLMQRGQRDEAVGAVEQIVQMQPSNAAWLVRCADLMVRLDRFDKASEYYAKVWEFRPSPEVAMIYLDALLGKNPPDIATAQQVLVNPNAKTDNVVALRLQRARWYRLQRKMKEATDEVMATYAMVEQNQQNDSMQFISGLQAIYTKQDERAAALDALEKSKPFTGWMKLAAEMVKANDPASRDAVSSELTKLAESSSDVLLKSRAYGIVGGFAYDKQQWEAALNAFKRGLLSDPESPELNNNVAFLLAAKLGKPEDALHYAEKAVKASPNNSGFLDTLAAVYIGQKNWPKASEYLAQAISVAGSDAQRAPVFMHMAKVQLEMGNKSGARRLMQQASDIIQAVPALRTPYESDLKDLGKAIDGV